MLKLTLDSTADEWAPIQDSIAAGLQSLAYMDSQAGYTVTRHDDEIGDWAWQFAHDRSILIPDPRGERMRDMVANWSAWYRSELERYSREFA